MYTYILWKDLKDTYKDMKLQGKRQIIHQT